MNKRVLISGAGVSGLTLAYWLKRHGFVPTLVERSKELRVSGYKIDIRGAALEVVKRMGIYPAICASKTDMQGATIIDGKSGRKNDVSADLSGGRVEGDLEIMRGDLCRILYDQCGEIECLFGDSIKRISQNDDGSLVEFEKGAARTFDIVIGADGLHSKVRHLVFGEEAAFLKEPGLYISVFTIPNFLKLDRWEIEYFEPQKYVNVYSTRGDTHAKAGFAFAAKSKPASTREDQQNLIRDVFSKCGWEVSKLLHLMQDSPDFYFDNIAQVKLPHWSKGRVGLVGDAAYAPSPLSGQGTSVALVGAYVLAGELAAAHGDYKAAFKAYEKALSSFAKKNQEIADQSIALMSPKDSSLKAWFYQTLIQLIPGNWIEYFKQSGTDRITAVANDVTLKNY